MGDLYERLALAFADRSVSVPRGARDEDGGFAPTYEQARLLAFGELHPGSTSHHLGTALRLRGALDAGRLAEAATVVAARHELLRATFTGTPRRVRVGSSAPALAIERAEASESSDVAARLRALRASRFDVGRAPPWSAAIVSTGPDEHVLAVAFHRLIADGWSLGLFLRDLEAAYVALGAGAAPALAEPAASLADFAGWEAERLVAPALRNHLARLGARLAAAPALLDLPTDAPRPPALQAAAASVASTLDAARGNAVASAAKRLDVTPFMLLLALWAALLARLAGARTVAVGVPVANRARLAFERTFGPLASLAAVPIDVDPREPFEVLLARVREDVLEAFGHQELPIGLVDGDIGRRHDASHAPLAQALFNFQNTLARRDFAGLPAEFADVDDRSLTHDVKLAVTRQPGGGLDVRIFYLTDLFEPATAEAWLAAYLRGLEGALARPAAPVEELTAGVPARAAGGDTVTRRGYAVPLARVARALEASVGERPTRLDVAQGSDGEPELVARVAAEGRPLDVAGLRRGLRRALPEYMMPDAWQPLEAPDDRLDAPGPGAAGPSADPVEARVAEIFQRALGVARLDRTDDFFELGGDSAAALRILTGVAEAFGVRHPVSVLLQAPTVAELAALVRKPPTP